MIHPDLTELFIYFREPCKALKIIQSGKMECSKAPSFNDPFDCSIPLDIDYDPTELVAGWIRLGIKDGRTWDDIKKHIDKDMADDASLNDAAKKRIDEQAKKLIEENSNMGIVCFTEDPASVLMWSHYGGKHSGIVLGFAREDGNELGDEDACSPVVYSDVYPTPRFAEILHTDGRLTEKLMLTKAREWAYEKEWRAFYEGADDEIDIPSPVRSVIVGCRTPSPIIDICRDEATRIGARLLQAQMVPGQFALTLADI